MYLDRPALKRQARQAMRAARPNVMLITLLCLLLTSGLSLLIGLFISDPWDRIMTLTQQGLSPDRSIPIVLADTGPVGLFLHILVVVFGLVVTFGYDRWSLNAARDEHAGISDLVSGFSMVGRVLWMYVLLFALCLFWAVFLLMAAQLLLLVVIWIPIVNILSAWTFSVLAAVFFLSRILRYAMCMYCLLDEPELDAIHALRRSSQLMKGHILDCFFLELSFLGWHLLSGLIGALAAVVYLFVPLAGGILAAIISLASLPLTLWLKPYIAITECKFYDRLCAARPTASYESPFD